MNDLSKYFTVDHLIMRRVTPADVDELVKIINEAYSYQDEAGGEPRTSSEHLTKRIGETDFYVIEDDKAIVGCVYLESHTNALYFGLLTLVPDYRGSGIAKRIISAIESYGKANRFVVLELDYMSVAPWLKGYYENYGFIQTDQVVHWGNIDLFRMRKSL